MKKETKSKKDGKFIKFVKAAGMWCTTIIEKGVQKQTWTVERPE